MSLFKAYNLVRTAPALDNVDIKGTFLDVIAMTGEEVTRENVVALVSLYTSYSINYLEAVATSLEDFPEASASMKFMNSYIAEAVHKAGLHYYHMEGSHSIIDKPIQFALDNGGVVTTAYVEECIQEIEDSYIEPEVEEELEDVSTN
jgi:hypothetical protein